MIIRDEGAYRRRCEERARAHGGGGGVTTGKVHDVKVMANLTREDDRAVYGDKGYGSNEKRSVVAVGALGGEEDSKPGRDIIKR